MFTGNITHVHYILHVHNSIVYKAILVHFKSLYIVYWKIALICRLYWHYFQHSHIFQYTVYIK